MSARNFCPVLFAVIAFAIASASVTALPALAQDFRWPWDINPAPVPREPMRREQPRPSPQDFDTQPGGGWAAGETFQQRNPICLELERRLVQENRDGSTSRQRLPAIRQEMREADKQLHSGRAQLERANCYEHFLFSKTLRRTRKCIRLARQVDQARRRLADLEAERQQLSSSTTRSRQSEIVRELARNRCGDAYVQEARRRDYSPFSSLWQDQDSGGGTGYGNTYNRLPFATYRTLCVRLCDGYYFPVSFSTLPNHFERDAATCQSKCVAPTELYYHQNPGAGVDDMVAFSSNQPYKELKSAFRYRKEYVKGCSCKQAEYIPQTPEGGTIDQGSLDPGSTTTPQAETAQARRALSPAR